MSSSRTGNLAAALLNHPVSLAEDAAEESAGGHEAAPGFCSECTDQPHSIKCTGCAGDVFCEVCFSALHRRGSRRAHTSVPAISPLTLPARPAAVAAAAMTVQPSGQSAGVGADFNMDDIDDTGAGAGSGGAGPSSEPTVALGTRRGTVAGRAEFIPLRLHYEERRLLRLVEAALNVSEYTDKVDVLGGSKAERPRRVASQLKALFSTLCGLLVAEDYEAGKALIQNSDVTGNDKFYSAAFEIARRYKILNPDRMRNDYGKMLFLLQDSKLPEVASELEINIVSPIKTVRAFLEARGPRALALLEDPLIEVATMTIISNRRARHVIDAEIKRKNRAVEALATKYAFGDAARVGAAKSRRVWWSMWSMYDDDTDDATTTGAPGANRETSLSQDDIRHCLYSIGDNNTFLVDNVVPVERMIELLQSHFEPNSFDGEWSLGIMAGVNGARLSHSHGRQFSYARQSLLLWHSILRDFYRFWILAETDFLDSGRTRYSLRDTGQGLNRVQPAPRCQQAMSQVLHECRSHCGGDWVGSTVVHLGDHNVPNAFSFLDKYTQVSRLLAPVSPRPENSALLPFMRANFNPNILYDPLPQKIVLVIDAIPGLVRDYPGLVHYINADFGSPERLVKVILLDFFRHAFDGSGADNFFDAGSCIDGRLTSAWEWCSRLDRKAYAPIFRLCSVLGFDGKWDKS